MPILHVLKNATEARTTKNQTSKLNMIYKANKSPRADTKRCKNMLTDQLHNCRYKYNHQKATMPSLHSLRSNTLIEFTRSI